MTTRLHRELLKSPLARGAVGCASILFFVIALLSGFASWLRLAHARATAHWEAVPGTIEKAGIEETWSQGQTQFVPRVTYRFKHKGIEFLGDQIAPHELKSSGRSKAEEAIAAYSPGGEVTVYFDPEDPARSVLQPGARNKDYLVLGLPLLLLLFAYGFLQMLRRAKEADRSPEAPDEPSAATGASA